MMWRIFRTSNLFRQTTTSSRETSSSSSSSCTWNNGSAAVAVVALLSCQEIEQQPLYVNAHQSNKKSTNENRYGCDRRCRYVALRDGVENGNGDKNGNRDDGPESINFDRELSKNTNDHSQSRGRRRSSSNRPKSNSNGVVNLLWNTSRQRVQCEEEPPPTAAATASFIKHSPHREKSTTRRRLQTSGNNEGGLRLRRRRMTSIGENNLSDGENESLDSSEEDKDINRDDGNDNDNHEDDASNHDNVMYSTKFHESEESNEGDGATATMDRATSTERLSPPPFSPKRVASFSYHGLEPHLVLSPFVEEEDYQNAGPFSSPHENSAEVEGNSPPSSPFLNFFGSSASVAPDTTTVTTAAAANNSNMGGRHMVTTLRHKINQDRGHVIHPYGMHDKTALFAVYDGHGAKGDLLAEYTMHALSAKLQVHPTYLDTDGGEAEEKTGEGISTALRETICEIDEEIKREIQLQSRCSGCTACVAVLRDRTLWVANVGDSRAVLAQRREGGTGNTSDYRLHALDLSTDQNANIPQERERILSLGGHITTPEDKTLSPRVWLDHRCTLVGLAMSRSIGDHALESVGVIAEPVIERHEVEHGDEFLILASDGIWEFISSEEAVHIVEKCFDSGLGADEACKELVRVATQQWVEKEGDYRDDITAIVVCLDDIWDASATATAED